MVPMCPCPDDDRRLSEQGISPANLLTPPAEPDWFARGSPIVPPKRARIFDDLVGGRPNLYEDDDDDDTHRRLSHNDVELGCGTHDDGDDTTEHEHAGSWRRSLAHRRLDAGDCSGTFTNPHEQYDPYASGQYAGRLTIKAVVHVIMQTGCTSQSCGLLSPACIRSGIDYLNQDFLDAGIAFEVGRFSPWLYD